MGKNILRSTLVAVAALLLAAPLAAEVYLITLENGNTFETRYRPRTAAWDEGTVLLMTTMGNWMSLQKSQITEVAAETATRGFGQVINGTTIELGVTANDQPVPGSQTADPQARLLQLLEARAAAASEQPTYDTQQFVEPSAASGIPVGYTQQVTPPLGSVVTDPE